MPILGESLVYELLDLIGTKKNQLEGNINCPFVSHNDVTASFHIYLDTQTFNCFGCKANGSLIELYEELTQKQVLVDLDKPNRKDNYIDVDDKTILPKINFLELEAIRQKYIAFINKRKIKKEILDLLNQYVCVDQTSKYYGYLVFEHDTNNKFICGRLLLEDLLEGYKRHKYMFEKGVPRTILGLSFLDPKIKCAILVEGIYDWFTLVQLGFNNVLCTFGTQISKDELYKLVDRVSFCLIVFDKDYAGFDGTNTTSKILSEFDIKSLKTKLPLSFGKDLNNALENGMDDEIISFINGKLNMVDYSSDDGEFNQKEWFREHFRKDAPKLKSLPTGIERLDQFLGKGIKPGLVTILGYTGQGKSAFTIYLCNQILGQQIKIDKPCKMLYVTYEISMDQVWSRLVSIYSEYAWPAIEEDRSIIGDKEMEIGLFLSDYIHVRTNLTFEQIIEMSSDYDVIVIDYMQIAPSTPATAFENQTMIYDRNFALMSIYGQTHNKTFIVLSSTAKIDYKNRFQASTKWSGGGDFSAYLTFILFREDSEKGENYLKCFIKKNTRGISGATVYFVADFAHNSFAETDPKQFAD